jgi:signal transduction histidine kinase
MDRVRASHALFLQAEHSLSARRTDRVRTATLIAIVATFIVAGVAGAILAAFIRRQLHVISADYERALASSDEASRAKDRMFATVSHELRTPMTSIIGWTSLLRKSESDPELMPLALASIEQSAHLQARLVDDLLDVSRISSGKLSLEVSDIDPRRPLSEAVKTMQLAAEAKGIALNATMASGEVRLHGDAFRLQQVFGNLISNSVRYTPAGGRIDVHALVEDAWFVVRVADSGIGIAPEFLPRIFEPFAQERAAGGATSGLGLGLGIARHVVELHHGTIEAKSEGPGRGSEFVVRLPLHG